MPEFRKKKYKHGGLNFKLLYILLLVPPPIPPRGNRDKESGHHQGTNVCHVSTTYIGGSTPEASTGQPSLESSVAGETTAGLTKAIRDEVTIGNQSTHSSQVSVTNKHKPQLKQTGLQLQISVNSTSNSPTCSSSSLNSTKKQTDSKLPSHSTSSSSNRTGATRTSRSSKDGPKIKKLRDLLLADSNVESS